MVQQVAFVLGGGGRLGAAEVGMLEALTDAGVRPDLIVGSSIGAINGAAFAAEPTARGVRRLRELWSAVEHTGVFGGRMIDRLRHMARTRTSLHSNEALRHLLERSLPVHRFEDLAVRFECVAACIETAHETWFDRGDLVTAVLASSAVPGLLPAVRAGDRHYLDGGIVESIPVHRAIEHGARTIYVLQVGRVEQPLSAPRWPHEVALVAFEIARRHSFASALANLPADVEVHVLPTGGQGPRFNDLRQLRYRDFADVPVRIDLARDASAGYLADRGAHGGGVPLR
jgi:NTE family protein